MENQAEFAAGDRREFTVEPFTSFEILAVDGDEVWVRTIPDAGLGVLRMTLTVEAVRQQTAPFDTFFRQGETYESARGGGQVLIDHVGDGYAVALPAGGRGDTSMFAHLLFPENFTQYRRIRS